MVTVEFATHREREGEREGERERERVEDKISCHLTVVREECV